MKNTPNYVVITPAHNEEDFIEITIQSMISQTLLPREWIIVDDGSDDLTAGIVEKYLQDYPFIKLIKTADRELKNLNHSEGLVNACEAIAFNIGYSHLTFTDYDFVVKLDADLAFDRNYFSNLLYHLDETPNLGLTGGFCYIYNGGRLEVEKMPIDHVRGPTKIYRKACFAEIGGIQETLGWDTIDELKAQMYGWETRSYVDSRVIHLRQTGTIDGILKGKVRHGVTAKMLGYHPFFMLGRAIYQLMEPPLILGGFALMYGFVKGYVKRVNSVVDTDLKIFLRKKQVGRLLSLERDRNLINEQNEAS